MNIDNILPKCPKELAKVKVVAYTRMLKEAKEHKVSKKHIKRYERYLEEAKEELESYEV